MTEINDFSLINMGIYEYDLNFKEPLLSSEDKRLYGEIDFAHETITIDHTFSENHKCITMLHEVCHSIEHIFEIDEKCTEEERVSRYAKGFALFLTHNPGIQKLFSHEGD